ncbi:hypothetical protein Syun_017243 [Stephania yunnanensis]|uniref:Uncharacterized protein n=1 Tax=Stephania yunnanensis TaxID=152371 RepID=A0AAP0J8U1_9MAGN
MARGGRRREDREKREVSVRKKKMTREVETLVKRREKRSGKRGRERTEIALFILSCKGVRLLIMHSWNPDRVAYAMGRKGVSGVDAYLSDIVYLVHTVFGVIEMALLGSEPKEDRKGKRKLEDFAEFFSLVRNAMLDQRRLSTKENNDTDLDWRVSDQRLPDNGGSSTDLGLERLRSAAATDCECAAVVAARGVAMAVAFWGSRLTLRKMVQSLRLVRGNGFAGRGGAIYRRCSTTAAAEQMGERWLRGANGRAKRAAEA